MTTDLSHEPSLTDKRAKRLPIVDTDVHHGVSSFSDLLPYLSQVYQERLLDYGFAGGGLNHANNGGWRGYRADVFGERKAQPAMGVTTSNVEETRRHLFDECGIAFAMLTGGSLYGISSSPDIDYATALCRAFNDHTIEHWLGADKRFRFAIAICTQDPEGAVQEIERIADHPGVCAILMTCGAPRPFGQRFYHPIYEACERYGLAVALHFNAEGAGVNPAPTAAGYPTYYIEMRQARPSFYQAHLASFIFEGVFEKFPALKVAVLEGGFGWVPSFRWRMDMDWKGLRRQTPWVKKLPSEYMREHVRIASQPMEEPADEEALLKLIEWMDGERTLMFASDYPHWDWDDPAVTFTMLSEKLRQRIFVENARETFHL